MEVEVVEEGEEHAVAVQEDVKLPKIKWLSLPLILSSVVLLIL